MTSAALVGSPSAGAITAHGPTISARTEKDDQEVISAVSLVGPRATAVDAHDKASTDVSLAVTLELHSPGFISAWLGINALHLVCAVYVTQAARVLWFIRNPVLGYWTKLAIGSRQIYLPHASIVAALIAALHWWRLACMIWATLRKRHLAFANTGAGFTVPWACMSPAQPAAHRTASSASTVPRLNLLALLPRMLAHIWRLLFSRNGVFGVESRFFQTVFTLRELAEIVAQTVQAYRSSVLLSRRWLSNLLVALVVTNCWSTPVLQRVFRHQEGKERVACLLADTLLNMGSSVLIPFTVFWPYYQALDHTSLQFSAETIYDELWFTRFLMESRLLFSLALLDVFSKLVPHLAIYSSLADVTTLIRRTGPCAGQSKVLAGPVPADVDTLRTLPKAKQHKQSNGANNIKGADVAHPTRQMRSSCYKQTAVHAFFFVWGLAVLTLHLRGVARMNVTMLGCRQATSSWFVTDYPCSVYAYNCCRHNTTSPDEDSWTQVDSNTLISLSIAHCSALKVPHAIQRFPNLMSFNMNNNTLVEWSDANRISDTKHTQLIAIVIVYMNMTHLPDGLLGPLPSSLSDIEFSHTNLTTLPPDLLERWQSIATVYFEHSQLTAFPPQLFELCWDDLSLYGNQIETVPVIPAGSYYTSVELANNPIRTLPDDIGNGAILGYFSLVDTLVEVLPAWIYTNVESPVLLRGSPYCDAQRTDDMDNIQQLMCTGSEYRSGGNIPVELIEQFAPV